MRAHDAAIILDGEDLQEALQEAVVQHISTDTMITIGGVKMHLAAWLDPEHWSSDWEENDINPDEVYSMLSAAVED